MKTPRRDSRNLLHRLGDAFDVLRGRVSSRGEVMVAESPATSARARLAQHSVWKGAEHSRIYSDWVVSLLSPHQELQGDARTLRARARELARNNAFAGQFLEELATNVIGPFGMKMRAKTRDRRDELAKEVNAKIEAAWNAWWSGPVTADGTMSGVELEDLALRSVGREGELFARRVVGNDLPHGLGLQLIDPDLVDDAFNLTGPNLDVEVYMGVEVDARGRRRAFHIRDGYAYGPGQSGRGRIRIPASEMLHLYRPGRSNQFRGVTWLARAMAPLHDLERYHQNELVASAAGAAKMGFILNKGPAVSGMPGDEVTDGEAAEGGAEAGLAGGSRLRVDAEPGSVWELESGQEFQSWSPDHPSTAFGEFTRAVQRLAASGVGLSYESLSGDLSQVSYLSGRLGRQKEIAVYQRLQQWWIRTFRQPLFDWWLSTALLTGDLDLPGSPEQYREAAWVPRGFPWVDPEKDASAAKQMIELKLTTRTRLAAAAGDDFEEILEELEKEQKLAAKYGVDLSTALAPAGGKGKAPSPEDDAEDESAAPTPSRNGASGARRRFSAAR